MPDIQQRARGSVFDMMRRDALADLSAAGPPVALTEAFEASAHPTFERIRGAVLGFRTLATVRDALLPKLISGELRVKDAAAF